MIFLVRHGEAAASWGDHPDPGLSELGHAQARAVSTVLIERGAQRVVSSPMQRCRETAAPLAQRLNLSADISPAVSEITTPVGVTDRVNWLQNLMKGQWTDEMLPFCNTAEDYVESCQSGTVIFSHFVAINAVVGRLSDKQDVLVFRPGYCSVTALKRDSSTGKLYVEQLGDEIATRIL